MLEQVPIKFLNKAISLISSLIFLSSDSIEKGGNSTLLNPIYISQLTKVFFLLAVNLIKIQFVSFSAN